MSPSDTEVEILDEPADDSPQDEAAVAVEDSGSELALTGPIPDARRRPSVVGGTPTQLAGQEWLLASGVPWFDNVWDRLYDGNVTQRKYETSDVQLAAVHLLIANYDLSPDEAVPLIMGADPATLVGAVEIALFGPAKPHTRWSDWVRSAFVVNGIDMAEVPPDILSDVLNQLIITGRAADPNEFITSSAYMRKRGKMLKDIMEW